MGKIDSQLTSENLTAVRKTKLYEQIVSQLQSFIESGRLKHGDRLPSERELSSIFQVSRHSVREAIRILEEKNLLKTRLGSGTYINTEEESSMVDFLARAIFTEKSKLIEIFQFRNMIEPQIARLAAENATAKDIEALENILKAQEQALDNIKEYLNLDRAFHLALAKATNNTILVRIIERINGILSKSRAEFSQSQTRRQRSFNGHQKIIHAIKAKKPGLAAEHMIEHINAIKKIALQLNK